MDINSFIHYKLMIDERDKEHEKIFTILRSAVGMVTSSDTDKLKEKLTELVSAVSSHFMHEVVYMEEIQYPYITYHTLAHKKILSKLEMLLERFEEDYMYTVYGKLSAKNLLSDFDYLMSSHVDQDDRQYAEFALKSLV